MKIKNNISLDKIADLFKSSKKIAILGHKNIDGDCLGSMFALRMALLNLGKEISVLSEESIPDTYSYLVKYGELEKATNLLDFNLIVILDSSNLMKTSFNHLIKEAKNKVSIILIDHHLKSDFSEFVNFYFIDNSTPAVSQILFNLFPRMKIKIDKDIATCLLTGLITDTNNFQTQNTTSESLKVASSLVELGGHLNKIVKNAFSNKPVNILKTWGRVMERIYFSKKYNIAVTYLTYKDALEYGEDIKAFSGITNFLNSIKGVKILILLTEQKPGEIKVSLRTPSEKINLANFSSVLKGGGHPGAAGFLFSGNIIDKNGKIKIV